MSAETGTEQQDLSIYPDTESIETAKPIISFTNSWTSVTPIEPQEGRCLLCGKIKELVYEKNNQGYTMRLCDVCTMAYIESAKRIDSENRLEPGSSATNKENSKNIAKEQKHFLVRVKNGKHNHWIDIQSQTGMKFEKLDVPYDEAQHGLCESTGRVVLKKVVNDGFPPLVFVATKPTKQTPAIKPITVKFHDVDKRIASWTFEPYEMSELRKGSEEGLSVRQLGIKVCAPVEAVENLLEKLGGDMDGRTRNKSAERGRSARSSVTTGRKNASR